MEQGREVALALLLHARLHLLVHEILVDRPHDRSEHTERYCAGGLPREPREREREPRVVAEWIVAEEPPTEASTISSVPSGRMRTPFSPQRTSSPAFR